MSALSHTMRTPTLQPVPESLPVADHVPNSKSVKSKVSPQLSCHVSAPLIALCFMINENHAMSQLTVHTFLLSTINIQRQLPYSLPSLLHSNALFRIIQLSDSESSGRSSSIICQTLFSLYKYVGISQSNRFDLYFSVFRIPNAFLFLSRIK